MKENLQPFTVRLPEETLTSLGHLAEALRENVLGTKMDKVNRQSVARLALVRGIEALQYEMSGRIPELPEQALEFFDELTDALERFQELGQPVARLLRRLDTGAEVLERIAECEEGMELLERLSMSEGGADVLAQLAGCEGGMDVLERLAKPKAALGTRALELLEKYTSVHPQPDGDEGAAPLAACVAAEMNTGRARTTARQ